MELERMAVAPRPRGAWEGLDLGFALARDWFLPLWLLWWCAILPMALLCLLLTGLRPELWLLAVWWLKPVAEGPLLAWSSRALFGEPLGWRRFPEILRAGWPGRMLPYLLWRRIGMRRSFLMPLTLLEDLRGPAARGRRRVMNDGGGVPFWLTLVCYHFEAILWAGCLLSLHFLAPADLPRMDPLSALSDSGHWGYWVSVIAYVLAFSCIAPFYVCAGFALYLTRRTDLEAWDLELAFRQAREADSGRTPPDGVDGTRVQVSAARLSVMLATLLLLSLPGTDTLASSTQDPEQARVLIREILAEPDFGSTKEVVYWAPIETGEGSVADPSALPLFLRDLLLWLARLLKGALLALAAGVLLVLVVRIRREGWPRVRRRRPPASAPLDSARSSSADVASHAPEDVAAAVRARLRADDRRGALALLYRASLAHLQRLGPRIPDGATEAECLAIAVRSLPAHALGPLAPLTQAWRELAYAHRVPARESLDALLLAWCRWTGNPHGTNP